MTHWAYYNEIDAQKTAWLRELIKQNLITPGEVDERSIQSVQPDDIRHFRRCHFFAGIGIWDYALNLAGFPEDEEVWTGSCPCQPFSAAGKTQAFDDPRHLWPEFFRLIEARRPQRVFGEQVSSIGGLAWFDAVRTDLDHADYTVGCLDTCAASVGAPHRRQRLYWVADSEHSQWRTEHEVNADAHGRNRPRWSRDAQCVGESASARLEIGQHEPIDAGQERATVERGSGTGSMADSDGRYASTEGLQRSGEHGQQPQDGRVVPMARGPVNGYWSGSDWVLTRPQRVGDSPRLRPVEPASQPVVDGSTKSVEPCRRTGFPLVEAPKDRALRGLRTMQLRGYGDGIVAQQAAVFIRAYLEVTR